MSLSECKHFFILSCIELMRFEWFHFRTNVTLFNTYTFNYSISITGIYFINGLGWLQRETALLLSLLMNCSITRSVVEGGIHNVNIVLYCLVRKKQGYRAFRLWNILICFFDIILLLFSLSIYMIRDEVNNNI